MFQHLIAEIAEKFGFSLTQSGDLVREILRAVSTTPGGLSEVLRKLRAAGIEGDPGAWLAGKLPALTPAQVTDLVGSDAVTAAASLLHVAPEAAVSAAAYAVPKLLALLAPDGHAPAGLPAEAVKFLTQDAGGAAHGQADSYDHGHAPVAAAAVQKPKLGDWAVRGAVLVAVLALLWWLTPRGEVPSDHARAPAPAAPSEAHAPATPAPTAKAPTAQAPAVHAPAAAEAAAPAPAKPAEPVKTVDPTLILKEAGGTVTYGGVVPDEATRTGILAALGAAFGADKISGSLRVDPQAGAPAWLAPLPATLGALKFAGLDALFNGKGLTLNALPAGFDRDKLLAALGGLFGAGRITLPPAPPAPAAPVAAPVAPATPAAPAPAAAPVTTGPSRLWLREIDGTLSYDGVVPDEATRAGIVSALSSVFGAGRLKGDLAINPSLAAPSWLGKLGELLGLLKGAGFNLGLAGDSIDIKALAPSVDREKLLAALRGLFPTASFNLADVSSPQLDAARVLSALEALTSGYSGADVTASLNQFSIQFATDSAAVPDDARPVLGKAAALIKALPAGARIVIEGYTDNVGDPAYNLTLSQERANAVREIFVAAGIDPAALSAAGYGQSNPVASNDTPEGRARNRRITYELHAN